MQHFLRTVSLCSVKNTICLTSVEAMVTRTVAVRHRVTRNRFAGIRIVVFRVANLHRTYLQCCISILIRLAYLHQYAEA